MDDNELLRYCLCAARNHVGSVNERNDALLFDLLQAIHNWPEYDNDNVLVALNALAAYDNAVRRWKGRNDCWKLNESSENR